MRKIAPVVLAVTSLMLAAAPAQAHYLSKSDAALTARVTLSDYADYPRAATLRATPT